jgi:hypothetical protein
VSRKSKPSCDVGLPCGKLDCPFTPGNAVETRRIESPDGLKVKKLVVPAGSAVTVWDSNQRRGSVLTN